MQLQVESKAPAGSRIVSLKVNGEPLDPQKTYKVASNNFMLAGGDGYDTLAQGKTLIGATDGTLLANEVIRYIQKLGTVALTPEGRILIR